MHFIPCAALAIPLRLRFHAQRPQLGCQAFGALFFLLGDLLFLLRALFQLIGMQLGNFIGLGPGRDNFPLIVAPAQPIFFLALDGAVPDFQTQADFFEL